VHTHATLPDLLGDRYCSPQIPMGYARASSCSVSVRRLKAHCSPPNTWTQRSIVLPQVPVLSRSLLLVPVNSGQTNVASNASIANERTFRDGICNCLRRIRSRLSDHYHPRAKRGQSLPESGVYREDSDILRAVPCFDIQRPAGQAGAYAQSPNLACA